MKQLFSVLLALGLVLGASRASVAQLTAVADEWPPFSGSALPNKGLSLDIIQTVLERAGYKIETKILPWARIVDGARKGAHDIIGSLFIAEDMKPHVAYADSYYTTDVKFVRRVGGSQRFESLAGLRPYSIVVGDGFFYEKAFDTANYLNKIVVTTTLQGVQMVAHGRADLTLDSVEVVLHALRRDDPTLRGKIEFLPKPLASRDIHMAVRKNLPMRDKVIADFNRTLKAMKRDGSYATLLMKHKLTDR